MPGDGGGNGRSKNDKNWENWERIREQKLERMKNICFESYRQSKRDRMQQAKPKPKQLDPTWYTDNIYSNRSEDLEDDYIPDCLKYGAYRKLRNIREQDEFYDNDDLGGLGGGGGGGGGAGGKGRRGEGEGSTGYGGLHRSTSCKEFPRYQKSQSCCFEGEFYEAGAGVAPAAPVLGGILKNRNVPKSYSFSASSKTTPFDVMDYDVPPPTGATRRDKQEAFRKSMGYYCSSSFDEGALARGAHPPEAMHPCCVREHSAKCLYEEDAAYAADYAAAAAVAAGGGRRSWRRGGAPAASGMYGAGASGGSNRNLHAAAASEDWLDDPRLAASSAAAPSRYALYGREREPALLPPPPQPVCCCAAEDYCYHRQQQHRHMATIARSRSRLNCPGHHPAAEEEEHMHCRAAAAAAAYDTDLEHFIRDERERLMLQDKFLDEDERYLATVGAGASHLMYGGGAGAYRRPARSKSLLEVQPPSRYDEDTCSDSTEMDLEDFNIDLEKYWEELEKPPSPIDLDMQRRNMQSNMKVKNVNVGCYNNGQPIDLHDREQERMMIKKSLLEGMPSPPQLEHLDPGAAMHAYHNIGSAGPPPPPSSHMGAAPNNANAFHFFDHAGSPLHHRSPFHYGRKVYPAVDTLPSYKYNNFYSDHHDGIQTQQPTTGGHHPAVGGHSALSLINNIFSIYKPNKYSPHNCQMNVETKPEPCKKMNVPSTRRPLGAPHSEYMHSMKRPLIVSTEQPHFKIIPEKTGLKISPLYSFEDYGDKPQVRQKLTSTARPLMLPH